jgi:hypothetical protein
MIMDNTKVLKFLQQDTNWTKDVINKDLWSYCEISETLKIGRQKFDWAIFKRNKNLNFYFTDRYREIPAELINDLSKLLENTQNEKNYII